MSNWFAGIGQAMSGLDASRYGRPTFGGTSAGGAAYDSTGTYVGDTGSVVRMVGPNSSVSVSGQGPAVIGSGSSDAFAMLSSISSVQRAPTAQTAAATSLTTQLSSIEDVDPAQVAIQLTTANTAYQAALQTTASIRQLSLLDFLK